MGKIFPTLLETSWSRCQRTNSGNRRREFDSRVVTLFSSNILHLERFKNFRILALNFYKIFTIF